HTSMGRFADGNGVNPMALLAAVVEQPSGALAYVSTKVGIEPTGVWKRMASIEGSDDQEDREIVMAVEFSTISRLAGAVPAEPESEEIHELNLGGGFVPTPTE